jgi:hypothetical protein
MHHRPGESFGVPSRDRSDARVLGGGDGSFDANGGIIEVDIRPAKCADLASSSARCDRNLEPGDETRVSGCGCCQQGPDYGDGGRLDDRTRNFRPGRNRHRVARQPSPTNGLGCSSVQDHVRAPHRRWPETLRSHLCVELVAVAFGQFPQGDLAEGGNEVQIAGLDPASVCAAPS